MSIIFEGNEYYISDWKNRHPGGSRLIDSAIGHDITELYKSYHNIPFNISLPMNPNNVCDTYYEKYIFSDKYNQIQKQSYLNNKQILSDKYDIIMWISFILYFLDLNCIFSGILLIILGGYGHQYVHTSSNKASMLTLVGFISNQWRDEHVFSHHPHTNTKRDVDLVAFMDINKIPLPSILRFLIISVIIVIRPFIQYFIPKYLTKATYTDIIFMVYNIYDLYSNLFFTAHNLVFFYWFIKRLIPSIWFLIIDYFNHYNGVETKKVSNDWLEQQLASTQNFVFSKWLYTKHPFIHSLLTFGLDRQVEHHICPKVKMENLSKINLEGFDIKTHYFTFESLKIIFNNFV